ncbi:DUF427 domain-containing protein [Thermopolyspora sp. NPDC052614]|uniref:DUF427 domain-containing protein n=1 Tax=Thermopolyspora sp. NPDC052614 TaxID=3155682 RepID=UPI00344393F8
MEQNRRGRVRVEPTAKRVRVYLDGRAIADSTRVLMVWEVPYYPTYYFPLDDVDRGLLQATGETRHSPSRGEAHVHSVGDRQDAALVYLDSPMEEIKGHVRFDWGAMDAWFEEDEEIFTHPRDPYSRVDILASSRHVRVEIDGVTVADSHSPRILFETGLPPRYYLPKTDVRLDLLEHTDTVTHCPYKGEAEYWSVVLPDADAGVDKGADKGADKDAHKDIVWSYRMPLPESQKIAGLMSFYNEKVDIYLDGVLQERPKAKF